jgi:hypothetical protein
MIDIEYHREPFTTFSRQPFQGFPKPEANHHEVQMRKRGHRDIGRCVRPKTGRPGSASFSSDRVSLPTKEVRLTAVSCDIVLKQTLIMELRGW